MDARRPHPSQPVNDVQVHPMYLHLPMNHQNNSWKPRTAPESGTGRWPEWRRLALGELERDTLRGSYGKNSRVLSCPWWTRCGDCVGPGTQMEGAGFGTSRGWNGRKHVIRDPQSTFRFSVPASGVNSFDEDAPGSFVHSHRESASTALESRLPHRLPSPSTSSKLRKFPSNSLPFCPAFRRPP